MRWFVLFALLWAAVPAQAAPVPLEQPPVVARTVAVLRPFRVYADPALPAERTGLRELSMSDVEGVALGFFRGDERFVPVSATARLLQLERSERQRDLTFIAQQSARLGAEHFRTFNLASAASELEASLEAYDRTARAWTHPDEVGDALMTLALVELELASGAPPEVAARHEARAQEAFRELIRVQPGRVLDPAVYPPSVVAAWRQAYASHFIDAGAGLRLDADDAGRIAALLDVDMLVWALTMTDASGTRILLQVYDAITGRFERDESFGVTPRLGEVSDALTRRLSITTACQNLVLAVPEVAPQRELGAVYVGVGFSSATYLQRPTDRLFYNRGARVTVHWMLQETFGVYLSGAQWVARRDRDGDLLSRLDSTRGSLGIVAGGRLGGIRAYATGGFDMARIGRLRTADAFWCKVSEGEPFEFDEDRACEEGDVTDAAAQGQFGLSLGLGFDARVVGPFWMRVYAGGSLTIAPFEDRTTSAPVWADAGLVYRF